MSTVFVIPGAFGSADAMPPMLQGDITRGNTVEGITYPNDLLAYWPGTDIGEPQILQGATTLDEALNDTPGQKIVMSHSLGSAVANRWLATFGPTSAVDPGEVTFYLLGDSMRRYGGFVYFNSGGSTNSAAETTACPLDTPFSVFNIVRQYDGWGDWPTSRNDSNFFGWLDAVENAMYGMNSIHVYYQDVDLNDPAIWKYQEGNVLYMVVPTFPVPMVSQWYYTPSQMVAADPQYRTLIEGAYARPPFTIPSVGGQTQTTPPSSGSLAPAPLGATFPTVTVNPFVAPVGGTAVSTTQPTPINVTPATAAVAPGTPQIAVSALPLTGPLAQPLSGNTELSTADRRVPLNS